MLLKEFQATNSRGSLLNIPLEDVGIGFYIRDIKGLDPAKATLVSSSFANQDGEQYHSSRRQSRNLVLTLGLDPDYAVMSVEELRKQLYSYFMPKLDVLMTFTMFDRFATDFTKQTLKLDIEGRIESFEAGLFTEDPTAVISIMCFNPDFYDPNTVTFEGSTVTDFTETILTYDGNVDTGVIFTMLTDRDLSEFTIYHIPPDQTLRTVDFQMDLIASDQVTISSVRGDKYAILRHGSLESSVLYAIAPQSAWLELQEGDNSIRVFTADGTPIPYTITYTNKYGGL